MKPSKKRHRGRRVHCPCRNESFVFTRRGAIHEFRTAADQKLASKDVESRVVNGWTYLLGDCGGGAAVRFQGAAVVDSREVFPDELKSLQSLPVKRVDELEAALGALKEAALQKYRENDATLDRRQVEFVQAGLDLGVLLVEQKQILGHRVFGVYLERKGIDRTRAVRSMEIARAFRETPQIYSTSNNLGYEKAALLARLPAPARVELIEAGVPVQGQLVPIARVSYRQLNAHIQSVRGKSTRGRKPKAKPEPDSKPAERLGLDIEVFEAFQAAQKGLHALKKKAKAGWSDRERPGARQLWGNVNHLFWVLQDELGMSQLLDNA